jgi:hypothetical protein
MKLYSKLLAGAALVLVASCGADSHTDSSISSEGKITITEREIPTPVEIINQYRETVARDLTGPGVPTPPRPNPVIPGPRPFPVPGGIGGASINPTVIVNLGKQIIDIIKENRGVASVQVDYANALPMGVQNVEEMSNFSSLQFQTFEGQATNGFGQEVVKIVYTLVHQYNGNYQGTGQYLSTVSVIPSEIKVAWGYSVNFKTSKIQAYLSDRSTEGNPVAGLIMQLQMDINNWLGSEHHTKVFEFHGDSPNVVSISP